MSVGNVERIIKKYASKIRPEHPNLPEHCYPHMVRRTRATNLYQDGTERKRQILRLPLNLTPLL